RAEMVACRTDLRHPQRGRSMVHPAVSLVMAGASVLALTLLYRSVREARAAGDLDAATALTLGTGLLITLPVAIVVASGGLVPCQDACSGLGFTGILPNEDLLGIALAVSIPFAFLGFRGSTRYALALYLGAMAIATGSRTATITAAIALLALLIVRPRLDGLG